MHSIMPIPKPSHPHLQTNLSYNSPKVNFHTPSEKVHSMPHKFINLANFQKQAQQQQQQVNESMTQNSQGYQYSDNSIIINNIEILP